MTGCVVLALLTAQPARAEPHPASPAGPQNGLLAVTAYSGVRLTWPTDHDPGFLLSDPDVVPDTVSWSPDGQLLAHVERGPLSGRLLVSDRAGGGLVDVTPFDARWEEVSWTPDGRLLALRSYQSMGYYTELWSMAADGSDPQLLLDQDEFGGRGATVSPDGGSLAFVRLTSAGVFELVRHELASGERTVLATDETYINAPDWSPDGQLLAFRTQNALQVVPAAGGAARTVVDESRQVRTLTWAPDGTQIGFMSHSAPHLHTVDVSSGDITTLSVPGHLLSLSMDWQPLPGCTVTGTDAGEELTGTPGDDVICPGGGNDVVVASEGVDVVLAGSGHDIVSYAGSPVPADVDLWANDGSSAGRSQLMSVEALEGSPFGDRLWGSTENDRIAGGDGDDELNGGPGDDALDGGGGTDTLRFEPAQIENDELTSHVDVDLQAGAATNDSTGDLDTLENLENVVVRLVVGGDVRGDDGPNVLDSPDGSVEGRGGDDVLVGSWASYESSPGPVRVNLVAGTAHGAAGNDTLGNVDAVIGSTFADEFRAGPHQQVYAGGGDDSVALEGFGDVVAGPGLDSIDLSAMPEAVAVAATGADQLHWRRPSEHFETWYMRDAERFQLTPYDDYFSGTSGAERIDGGGGSDHIVAGAGDDVVTGGFGRDRLVDGAGHDRLAGGPGVDVVLAGPGDDLYIGGRGIDLLDLTRSAVGVVVDLARSSATGVGSDGVASMEDLSGTAYGDVLRGDERSNRLAGGAGDDVLRGREGPDRLDGGRGADRCSSGPGDLTTSCG